MKVDVFISYHTESSLHIVEAIVNKLEGLGIRCWYSNRDNHRHTYVSSIVDAVEQCKVFLLVLNQSAANSHHVLLELERVTKRLARHEPVFVIPFHVADDELNQDFCFYIDAFHWLDAMTPPLQDRIEELAEYVWSAIAQQIEDEHAADRKPLQRTYEPWEQQMTDEEWEPDPGFDFEIDLGEMDIDPFDVLFEEDRTEPLTEPEPPKPNIKRGTSNLLKPHCFAMEELEKLMAPDGIGKNDVQAIRFTDSLQDAPDHAVDVSHDGDGSVLMWIDPLSDCKETLVVGADGIIDGHLACEELFKGMRGLMQIDFGHCFSTKGATSMLSMFSHCDCLETVDLSGLDTSEVTNMSCMFMFCRALTHLDVSGFDTSKVKLMNFMFDFCDGLEELDIRNFDFSSIDQIISPFGDYSKIKVLYDIRALNQLTHGNRDRFFESLRVEPLPRRYLLERDCFSYDNLGKLKLLADEDRPEQRIVSVRFADSIAEAAPDAVDVSQDKDGSVLMWAIPAREKGNMIELVVGADGGVDGSIACEDLFLGMHMLKKVTFGSAFDTHRATSMVRMFDSCSRLREVDLEALDTSNVRSMSYMLHGCENLRVIDVSRFNTSKVQRMDHMFDGCIAAEVIDLSNFDFSRVEQVGNMFGENRVCGVRVHPDSLSVLSKRDREKLYRAMGLPEEAMTARNGL